MRYDLDTHIIREGKQYSIRLGDTFYSHLANCRYELISINEGSYVFKCLDSKIEDTIEVFDLVFFIKKYKLEPFEMCKKTCCNCSALKQGFFTCLTKNILKKSN